MRYRRDVDGLRAVAVLAVVAFHAGAPGFDGGFVGVDVFFVISGFLITAIAARQVDTGSFGVLDFYLRRIRRILPAFFTMVAVVSVVASVALLPRALEEFGRSLVAAGAMLSNVFFVTRGGYFEAGADTYPLLHTWSLGVEEQFYIAFPVVMFLLGRFVPRRRWLSVAVLLGALSLLANLWLTARQPSLAFYLPVTRAWQFLAGSVLALLAWRPAARWLRSILGTAGLAAIVVAITTFGVDVSYPGTAALLPTLGAALVILAGVDETSRVDAPTPVERLLGVRPMVGIGLVSYSLYLWHWPALVLTREATVRQALSPLLTAAVLLASAALAVLSWRFVELPFRRWRPRPWRALAFGTAVVVVAVSAGVLLWRSDGAPGRFPPDVVAMEAVVGQTSREFRTCTEPTSGDLHGLCRHGAPDAPVRVAVWGDSHAATVLPSVVDQATRGGAAVLGLTRPVCPPTTSLGTRFLGRDSFGCRAFNEAAVDALLGLDTLSDVVLVARWAHYETWHPGPLEPEVDFALLDEDDREIPTAARLASLGAALQTTVDLLEGHGLRVHVVYPLPEFPFNVARAVAWSTAMGRDLAALDIPRDQAEGAVRAAEAMLDSLRLGPGSTRVDSLAAFCDVDVCRPVAGDQALFSDDDHLTLAGAEQLEPDIASILALGEPVEAPQPPDGAPVPDASEMLPTAVPLHPDVVPTVDPIDPDTVVPTVPGTPDLPDVPTELPSPSELDCDDELVDDIELCELVSDPPLDLDPPPVELPLPSLDPIPGSSGR